MNRLNQALIVLLACVTTSHAENRGNCPFAPPISAKNVKRAEPPVSTDPEKKYFGTVTLLSVISDKGYVCSAHVVLGIDKEFDKKAEKAALAWRLDPARKDGRPVSVLVRIDVNYWTTKSGEVVSDPPQLPAPQAK